MPGRAPRERFLRRERIVPYISAGRSSFIERPPLRGARNDRYTKLKSNHRAQSAGQGAAIKMGDWQCFCTTVNKPDARSAGSGLRRPDIQRRAPPARAPQTIPSPPPLPTAPAPAPRRARHPGARRRRRRAPRPANRAAHRSDADATKEEAAHRPDRRFRRRVAAEEAAHGRRPRRVMMIGPIARRASTSRRAQTPTRTRMIDRCTEVCREVSGRNN